MTRRTALDEALNRVIATSAQRVSGLGFVRRGFRLKARSGANIAIVEFQKSTSSSKDKISFTINLAVVCGSLLEPWEPSLEKAGSSVGHLRERIGWLMPERLDKWWEITSATDVNALEAEVADLIFAEGAPYIVRYLDLSELVALWRSGKSPGLTETQRVRYLQKLLN